MKNLIILHISPSYKPAYCYGGPIMSVSKLCEELHKTGVKTRVLTTLANGPEELSLRSGCQRLVDGVDVSYYARITKDHTHFSPALLIALYGLIKKARNTDQRLVIHVHSWWNLVAILSSALAAFHRIPLIVSPRGMITSYTLSFRNTLFKFFIHKAIGRRLLRKSHIHATSDYEAANIQQHLLSANLIIIPNLVTFPDSGIINNYPYVPCITKLTRYQIIKPVFCLNILFLSRIDKKKGLELLLHVLSNLYLNWKLTIAGSGDHFYVSQLKQLSVSLKISSKITWLGQVSNEDKYAVLAQHDLTVLLSSNENFANVVVESLSVGTPVLISDQVGLASYIRKSDLGWVCSLQPAAALQALNRIHSNPNKRNYIRKTAPDRIKADFNPDKIIDNYLQLYKTAASE